MLTRALRPLLSSTRCSKPRQPDEYDVSLVAERETGVGRGRNGLAVSCWRPLMQLSRLSTWSNSKSSAKSESLCRAPRFVRIEFVHTSRQLFGVLTQVFFVDNTVLIDNESHDARVAIFGRVRDEGEATRELAVDEIVFRTALGCWALLGQHAVVIAVERRRLALLQRIALASGAHDKRTDRAGRFVVAGFPVESVLLALSAHELQRVVLTAAAVVRGGGVFALRADEGIEDFDRVVFVSTDAAIENLFCACLSVEVPSTAAVLNDRNGHGPVVGADV